MYGNSSADPPAPMTPAPRASALAGVPSAAIATLIVMVTSYAVNRAWVFDASRPHTSSFPRFAAATGLSIVLNTGLMHVAVKVLAWPYLAGVVLTTGIVPPV